MYRVIFKKVPISPQLHTIISYYIRRWLIHNWLINFVNPHDSVVRSIIIIATKRLSLYFTAGNSVGILTWFGEYEFIYLRAGKCSGLSPLFSSFKRLINRPTLRRKWGGAETRKKVATCRDYLFFTPFVHLYIYIVYR